MPDVELAIIGGGVAGLTAGLFAVRAGVDTVLLERMGTGGQMINADRVENYPGFPNGIKGYELAPLLAEQAMNAGLRIDYVEAQVVRRAERGFAIETDDERIGARAVIITAGSTLARLGIPGEEEFFGRGVSQCAVCDGDFFREQPVAVIGGGDSAMDEALYLAEITSSVTVVHRRDQLRAADVLVKQARAHPNITFLLNAEAVAIEGNETVEALQVRVSGAGSRRLQVAGVFVYVGLRPNTAMLADVLPLDAAGHIPVDPWMRTSLPGLLAAGDIRQHSARQYITAAGDGATAALAAHRYLRAGEWTARSETHQFPTSV
jgi:thioredoxin reductase (NADPH)